MMRWAARCGLAAAVGAAATIAATVLYLAAAAGTRQGPLTAAKTWAQPLGMTAALVSAALIVCALLAYFSAACVAADASGPFAKMLAALATWVNGLSSIVVGTSALIATRALGVSDVPAMIAALVALNAPSLTVSFVRALSRAPARHAESAAAAGLSPAFSAAGVVMPAAWPAFRSPLLSCASGMVGQTAVVAALGATYPPLAVALWRDATNAALVPENGVRALAMIALMIALRAAAWAVRSDGDDGCGRVPAVEAPS
ncbi:MAG: hypothetical protein GIW99_00660 [Candidatus Eremiobacteraeota bacterium]|nr:hypothetical protein [Candidatus Eremiobacteraeota bacterium]MBC5826196.1 hypothetical protein [Candidatus Eremiobacteraeota bacterium]